MFFIKFFLYFPIFIFSFANTHVPQFAKIESPLFLGGIPYNQESHLKKLLIHKLFIVSYNSKTKFPDWLAYQLSPTISSGQMHLQRHWQRDPLLTTQESLEPKDYKNARKFHYDKGHLMALSFLKNTIFAQEANYLSNVSPQNKILNQGVWKKLEGKEKFWVQKGHKLWVLVGTLHEKIMPPLPKANKEHSIPSAFWKIIIKKTHEDSLQKGQLFVCSFVFPQKLSKYQSLKSFKSSLKEIKKRSQLNLFWDLKNLKLKESCRFLKL